MQGPTYALCYSTIVGYAAHVAPEGYSATVQGIVAGMDDGVGFALGSLLGGQLYARLGGRAAFRTLAVTAAIAAFVHGALSIKRKPTKQTEELPKEEDEKMLPVVIKHDTSIYKDTTLPLTEVSQNGDRVGALIANESNPEKKATLRGPMLPSLAKARGSMFLESCRSPVQRIPVRSFGDPRTLKVALEFFVTLDTIDLRVNAIYSISVTPMNYHVPSPWFF
ncbi:hypothetical protein RR46_01191 [Papilio xuthus]|uniref:Major facilitator superfamily associated domain-containing protein n=1 Tax=Papilio xuthus TaxID=66420 RepID=A0A0N1PF31_PAPXU|nr:hypothetical protein RR46_01191 [Papilio xuthus]